MAEVIRMPLLSDTMTEGKIIAWNKNVGDKVKSDDVLAEVETDKATMEVVGYADGTLLYVGVPAGTAAKVNDIIAIVGKEGEDYKSLLGTDPAVAKTAETIAQPQTSNAKPETPNLNTQTVSLPAGAKEIRMPLLSDTMTEGKIVAWNKKVGDFVKADDVLAEVETDKATMEVVGYEEGTLLYVGVEAGNAAKVNEIIAIVGKAGTDVSAYVAAEKSGANAQPAAATQAAAPTAEPVTSNQPAGQAGPQPDAGSNGRVKASPLAKKLAADKGIDINKVSGSGDGGRIVKKDIDNYVPSATPVAAPAAKPAAAQAPVFTAGAQEGHTDIPLTQMRKTIARRLGESKFSAPHFYLTVEINMDN
ncbi:MAG TPA: E3 binding domain-containing protein, partial [Ferruginibacter sp.]|nr:E3 binding domain-containing protein [Ferruginibacter sp.]